MKVWILMTGKNSVNGTYGPHLDAKSNPLRRVYCRVPHTLRTLRCVGFDATRNASIIAHRLHWLRIRVICRRDNILTSKTTDARAPTHSQKAGMKWGTRQIDDYVPAAWFPAAEISCVGNLSEFLLCCQHTLPVTEHDRFPAPHDRRIYA